MSALQAGSPPASLRFPIVGLVRDILCPVHNLEAKAAEFNRQCTLAYTRHASLLIIQAADGVLYLPISGWMPETDQREKLIPFFGKYVRAKRYL